MTLRRGIVVLVYDDLLIIFYFLGLEFLGNEIHLPSSLQNYLDTWLISTTLKAKAFFNPN